jgi:hypothetical protein
MSDCTVRARSTWRLGGRRGFAAALALLGSSAISTHVAGQSEGLEPAALSWVRARGAEVCPGGREVALLVEQRLGRPVLVPPARAKLYIEALARPVEGGEFAVQITLYRDAEVVGRRDLDPQDDCKSIAERAALAIALMIDPEALEPRPDATQAPRAPPPPAPQLAPSAPQRSKPPPPPPNPPPWRGDLEAAIGMATGLLPHLAPGVFLRGRLLPPEFPVGLELEGAYFLESTVEAEPGKGGTFELFLAGASVCSVAPRAPRLAASACTGVQIGSIAGGGYGFADTPTFHSLVYTLAARGRFWFRPVRGLSVVVGPDFAVPLKRDHFVTYDESGTTELFQVAPVNVGFELGAVWEF